MKPRLARAGAALLALLVLATLLSQRPLPRTLEPPASAQAPVLDRGGQQPS